MNNNHRTKIARFYSRGRGKSTLTEIVAVIAALIILAGLIVPKIMSSPDEARRVIARQDIGKIVHALELYRRDHGRYPTQDPGLEVLLEMPVATIAPASAQNHSYIEHLPNDPWDNPYQYRNPGVHGEIDVFSYGADGKQGGEGDDADIGSWQ
ncbi:general secretion pathway protein G [Paraburkholderia sp. GAS41]|jgi:general secretion pathway protein G|uniref:type II secretion system major pseudopilin GspG n=1 Tax=Paraburkholderia sp. GAS41 TaxID=3035134 RepID=UPI003D20FDBD